MRRYPSDAKSRHASGLIPPDWGSNTRPVSTGHTHNPAIAFIDSIAPTSRPSAIYRLNKVANIIHKGTTYDRLPWHHITVEQCNAAHAQLRNHPMSPASRNQVLLCVRRVMRWARFLRLITQDRYEDYITALPYEDIDHQLSGRYVHDREIAAIYQLPQCNPDTPVGSRNRAVIAILAGCGLRMFELSLLCLHDYSAQTGELSVTGKKAKRRTVPLFDGTRAELMRWLRFRGLDPGPMFYRAKNGGHSLDDARRPLARRNIGELVATLSEAAGQRFTPHDLRRTFISNGLDMDVEPITIQQLAGHRHIEQTMRYDRRGERRFRRDVEKMRQHYAESEAQRLANKGT